MDKLAITVDVGTTNCKVTLFRVEDARIIDRLKFKTYKLKDQYGELFDYMSIFREIQTFVIEMDAKYPHQLDSIIFATVGESGVLMNDSGDIVTPMIAWYDKRSYAYIDKLTEEDKKKLYSITGLPAHTNYSISKIKWLVDYYALGSSHHYTWLSVPDLFVYLFSGEVATEYSIASRTMALNLKDKTWSNEVLKLFKLDKIIKFPKIREAGETLGLIKQVNNHCLSHPLQLKIAGHDHKVGAYGIDLKVDDVLNSTGTTEGLLLISESLMVNNEQYELENSNGIYTNPKLYSLFASMPNGGNVFEWYQNFFNISHEDFEADVQKLYTTYQTGELFAQEKVTVIPHFKGSGAPFKTPNSKAMIYNLDLTTSRLDILFALLLGACLEMKHVSKGFALSNQGLIYVIGPAAKNKLWLQLKADALNKDLYAVQLDEVVSLGALSLAYKDKTYSIPKELIEANVSNNQLMEEKYKEYVSYYNFKKSATEKE